MVPWAFPSCLQDSCPAQHITYSRDNVQRQDITSPHPLPLLKNEKSLPEAPRSLIGQFALHTYASTYHWPGEWDWRSLYTNQHSAPPSWGGSTGYVGTHQEQSLGAVRREVGREWPLGGSAQRLPLMPVLNAAPALMLLCKWAHLSLYQCLPASHSTADSREDMAESGANSQSRKLRSKEANITRQWQNLTDCHVWGCPGQSSSHSVTVSP